MQIIARQIEIEFYAKGKNQGRSFHAPPPSALFVESKRGLLVEKVEIFIFTEELSTENMQTVGDFRLIIPKHDNTVNTRLFPGQQPAYYGLLLDAGNRKPRFHAFQTKTLRYARVRARCGRKKEEKETVRRCIISKSNFSTRLHILTHTLERVVLLASQDTRNMKEQGMIERNFELAVLRTKALSMKIS